MSINLATVRGTVAIRHAVAEDAAGLRALRLEALAGHPEAFAADYDAAAAEPVEAWVQRIADNALDDQGVIVVAAASDELVGMAGLRRGHWPKLRHSAIIWGVYVRPGWRGERVAEALLGACTSWAQAHEVVTVKLAVVTTNAPAIRCYERCGFAVYGTEPKAICCDGVFYDELLIAKAI